MQNFLLYFMMQLPRKIFLFPKNQIRLLSASFSSVVIVISIFVGKWCFNEKQLELCLDLWADFSNVQERFDHPYNSFLFYGVDTAGDFIPIKQLREKYNRPRHEVPFDPQDDEQRGDDW